MVVLFPKVGLAKGLVAVGAHKVLGMPDAVQGRHAPPHHGLPTGRAHLFEHPQIVFKAVTENI